MKINLVTTLEWKNENILPRTTTSSNGDVMNDCGFPNFLLDLTQASPGNLLPLARVKIEYSPLMIWELFFTDAIIQDFVVNTNNYAKNVNAQDYLCINGNDMKRFFAAVYLLGLNGVPEMRDARDHPAHAIPILSDIISRYKFKIFELIMRH
jgi:hypothetical protein